MNNQLLIDTSVLIDFLRSKNKKTTLLYRLAQSNSLAISRITHTELYAGKSVWQNPRAKQELSVLLSGLTVLSINERISEQAGKLRALHTIDLIDALIAATALHHHLPLATTNTKHFKPIPNLELSV